MSVKDYSKTAKEGSLPAKQVAHEMLLSRHSMSQITGGNSWDRTMNNYAKQTPMDADGESSNGLNIVKMSGWV